MNTATGEFHCLLMSIPGVDCREGRRLYDGSLHLPFNGLGVAARFFIPSPSRTNPDGRIDMEGSTTWAGTPNRLCWLLRPEIEGAMFTWRVTEFAFGWSGSRKVWTGWERVLTTGQAAWEVFTRLHTFATEAEQRAWL
jgi:hypothetical protein